MGAAEGQKKVTFQGDVLIALAASVGWISRALGDAR